MATPPEISICLSALGNEETLWMPCAHGFHKYCLGSHMSVQGILDMALLACPTCKRVPGAEDDANLLGAAVGDGEGNAGGSGSVAFLVVTKTH